MGLAAGIGAVVGLAGWFAPQTIGGGHPLAEEVLAGNVVLGAIPLWLVARYFTAIVRALDGDCADPGVDRQLRPDAAAAGSFCAYAAAEGLMLRHGCEQGS